MSKEHPRIYAITEEDGTVSYIFIRADIPPEVFFGQVPIESYLKSMGLLEKEDKHVRTKGARLDPGEAADRKSKALLAAGLIEYKNYKMKDALDSVGFLPGEDFNNRKQKYYAQVSKLKKEGSYPK